MENYLCFECDEVKTCFYPNAYLPKKKCSEFKMDPIARVKYNGEQKVCFKYAERIHYLYKRYQIYPMSLRDHLRDKERLTSIEIETHYLYHMWRD